MLDMRDPQILGETLLQLADAKRSIRKAAKRPTKAKARPSKPILLSTVYDDHSAALAASAAYVDPLDPRVRYGGQAPAQ